MTDGEFEIPISTSLTALYWQYTCYLNGTSAGSFEIGQVLMSVI